MKLTEEQKGVLEGERGKPLARYPEWSILWIPVIQVEAADLNWITDGDWVEVDSDRQAVRVYEPQ